MSISPADADLRVQGRQRAQGALRRLSLIPKLGTIMIPTHRAPTHPGEVLLEEFLKPMTLTQLEAAKKMGMSQNRLNEIVRGKRSIHRRYSPATRKALQD